MSASTTIAPSTCSCAGVREEYFAAEQPGRRLPLEIKQQILYAIGNIKYGSVEGVIHEGKVVQIECREKIRMNPKGSHTSK